MNRKVVKTMAAASSPTEEGPQIVIPDFKIESLARCLLPKIQAYFASPEGQAAFEEWKRQQENT